MRSRCVSLVAQSGEPLFFEFIVEAGIPFTWHFLLLCGMRSTPLPLQLLGMSPSDVESAIHSMTGASPLPPATEQPYCGFLAKLQVRASDPNHINAHTNHSHHAPPPVRSRCSLHHRLRWKPACSRPPSATPPSLPPRLRAASPPGRCADQPPYLHGLNVYCRRLTPNRSCCCSFLLPQRPAHFSRFCPTPPPPACARLPMP
jgi:hypothetical protein